eukprot:2626746-Karenia_brevis.AAC.1
MEHDCMSEADDQLEEIDELSEAEHSDASHISEANANHVKMTVEKLLEAMQKAKLIVMMMLVA